MKRAKTKFFTRMTSILFCFFVVFTGNSASAVMIFDFWTGSGGGGGGYFRDDYDPYDSVGVYPMDKFDGIYFDDGGDSGDSGDSGGSSQKKSDGTDTQAWDDFDAYTIARQEAAEWLNGQPELYDYNVDLKEYYTDVFYNAAMYVKEVSESTELVNLASTIETLQTIDEVAAATDLTASLMVEANGESITDAELNQIGNAIGILEAETVELLTDNSKLSVGEQNIVQDLAAATRAFLEKSQEIQKKYQADTGMAAYLVNKRVYDVDVGPAIRKGKMIILED